MSSRLGAADFARTSDRGLILSLHLIVVVQSYSSVMRLLFSGTELTLALVDTNGYTKRSWLSKPTGDLIDANEL